jgi:hypothetical protein
MSQQAIPITKRVATIDPPLTHMKLILRPRLDLPHSFALLNVLNKHRTPFVIDIGFNSVPNMSGSIDSSIFVMCHALFDAAGLSNHIGAALHRRHLAG